MRKHMGLFRGKRTDNGEWVYWDLFNRFTTPGGKITKVTIKKAARESYYYHAYQLIDIIDKDTIGECTGLRDKNGKLIYEGDIIENIDGRSIVFFDKIHCGFYMRFLDDYDDTPLDMGEMWDDTEIIGNIHNNQELLKGGESNG